MICEYCHSENMTGERCGKCGAKLPAKTTRGDPFFYNGYMVYFLRDYCTDTLAAYFFLGERLIEIIKVAEPVLRGFVKEGEDYMPFFFELFKVAQGEVEVYRVQEMNNKYPATFEVRRIENQELLRTELEIRDIIGRSQTVRSEKIYG